MSKTSHHTRNLPDSYLMADDAEMIRRIKARKNELGDKLVILTHHYQRMEVVALNDFLGDSYALAQKASEQKKAEKIVFCGVRFMAEAADILTDQHQDVYLANPSAGCPMADMAPDDEVYKAWADIESVVGSDSIIPLTYMNSSASLKAFCGRHGGLVCTSANAAAAFEFILNQGKKIFFFPDRHLGQNTARYLNIPRDEVVICNPGNARGSLTGSELSKARIILWHGNCPVHVLFTTDHILKIRMQIPEVKIVVHPECPEQIISQADSVGSTDHIINYIGRAPAGSVIAVGTELSLVRRMALSHKDKKIFCLADDHLALCDDMYRTTLRDLCFTLENFDQAELVKVPGDISYFARQALNRMLQIGS